MGLLNSRLPISAALVCAFVLQALAPSWAGAESKVLSDVRTQLKRMSGAKGSFCYAIEGGAVTGIDQDQPMKIASVAKVMTTFWAVDQLGPDHRFRTRVYVKPSTGEIHLRGTNDPFFDRDRLFVLLADLNKKKVTALKRITFDKNVRVDLDATEFRYIPHMSVAKVGKKKVSVVLPENHSHDKSNYYYINEDHTAGSLATQNVPLKLFNVFNTKSWSASMKSRYVKSRKANPLGALPASVSMAVSKVEASDRNPLADGQGVYVFDIFSAPLRVYLKKMNIDSINPMAEEVFFALGGMSKFKAFIKAKFGNEDLVKGMLTGSGVNLNNPRRDTMVACSTVVRAVQTMDRSLEAKGLDLKDVLMVAGVDPGTWSRGGGSLVVKTGTLLRKKAKTLAGSMSTTQGDVYFGIFLNDRADSGGVGAVESAMERNFKATKVRASKVLFRPIDAQSHMKLVGTIGIPRGPKAT